MSSDRLRPTDLPWLPRLSVDFRSELRAIEQTADVDWGLRLRGLAAHALGLNHSMAMAQALERLRADRPTVSLASFRLGLVSNATIDFVKPFLIVAALRHGVCLEVITADFGQIEQQAFDPDSQINKARPDAVLLAVDYRGLPIRTDDSSEWPPFDMRPAAAQMDAIRNSFRTHCGAPCLVQTIPAPPELLFGSLDASVAGTLRASILALNAHLVKDAAERSDVVVDVDWLAQYVGLDEWYDDRHWYLARMPVAQKALPLYADFVARVIGALRGRARKCLVLDLDNTLWGGVIGDDGMDGVVLNPGDARGEAYRAIQTVARDLRRRGIVLAVCSKNDEAIAREAFRAHPGMVLKEDDIAVFMANWDDKASNIERIARQLNLGLDAMVLLDDNPVERAQVRQALPQVAVPELPDDPSGFMKVLAAAGYFESTGFTREDLTRAAQYRGNAERAQSLEGSRNLDDFLRSLAMKIQFSPFDAVGRKRIAQLINKTNQFNVTTRRYSEQEVAAIEAGHGYYTLQVSVRDRFGDNGMISVVICRMRGEAWDIDTWLMSCRVLNRRVEEAVCNRIAADAVRAGATELVGTYVPTKRNQIVKDLFARLGFRRDGGDAEAERWVLDLKEFEPLEVFLEELTAG